VTRRARPVGVFAVLAATLACTWCSRPSPPNHAETAPGPATDSGDARGPDDATAVADAALDALRAGYLVDADLADAPSDDPMAIHSESREELLALFSLETFEPERYAKVRPDLFLSRNVGPGVATRMNQGNKAIAHHAIGKRACLAGLANVVIQTEDQKAACKGQPNMVPIYKGGDPKSARFCVDVFEFPNRPCELPFVWTAPTFAQTMCQLQGKRLCAQEEWNLACRGDPAGGADRTYAYGDDLDLDVCNTHKSPPDRAKCDARTLEGAWSTCGTHTEPAGAYPRCRSRFGVFDQHGNAAEVMTRKEPDGSVVTQLKGSAFFYLEVARRPAEPAWAPGAHSETYPDHCNYDPRWHVEPIDKAWHVNYHLGFRCCLSL
jgi:hypothetical protein